MLLHVTQILAGESQGIDGTCVSRVTSHVVYDAPLMRYPGAKQIIGYRYFHFL